MTHGKNLLVIDEKVFRGIEFSHSIFLPFFHNHSNFQILFISIYLKK